VRDTIRTRHYSLRTERSYLHWIRRFILFHGKRHPKELGRHEVSEFLTHLAVDENVAPATQNQALNAIVFLYRQVLEIELGWLDDVERAKKPIRLPLVLTRDEVARVLRQLDGLPRLLAGLQMTLGKRGKWRLKIIPLTDQFQIFLLVCLLN